MIGTWGSAYFYRPDRAMKLKLVVEALFQEGIRERLAINVLGA
jgi:hypothetical protein